MYMASRKKIEKIFILSGVLFSLLGLRYLVVMLAGDGAVFRNHDHFVLDFEYFYEMEREPFQYHQCSTMHQVPPLHLS